MAPRNARRAALEIESHFQHLIDEQTTRGLSEPEARSEAHRRLGANQELIRHYAERPELMAWSRRWPSICFTIVPLFVYSAISLAVLLAVGSIAHQMMQSAGHMPIAPEVTNGIEVGARIVLLWCVPVCVASAFTRLGCRSYMALRWPLLSIALISVLASFSNITMTLTGLPGRDEVGAGLGVSSESLPGQSMHAAVLVALSLMPLWWRLRRAQRERDLN
jgi:hypothetical protein